MGEEERQRIVAEMVTKARCRESIQIAEGYQITTLVPDPGRPPRVQRYTVPPQDMDRFFYDYSEAAEIVVDVRPIGSTTEGAGGAK